MVLTLWILILFVPVFLYFSKKYLEGGINKYNTDMTNKFIIVTGASGGLGKDTSIRMINAGAKVIFASRNLAKAEAAMKDIPQNKRENAIFIPLDLCSFESIKSFAEEIKSKYPPIDILINNAGAQPDKFLVTKDNLESFVQGNHIGPMYLTLLLIDHFSQSEARIINVSSCAQYYSVWTEKSPLILQDPKRIEEEYFKSSFEMLNLYSDCKLMNIYFTQYLKELSEKNYPHIKSMCWHPGFVRTEFFRYLENSVISKVIFKIITPIWNFLTKSTSQGAQVYHYLCMIPFNMLKNGEYYADCKVNRICRRAENKEIRKAIIDWSIQEIKARDWNISVW